MTTITEAKLQYLKHSTRILVSISQTEHFRSVSGLLSSINPPLPVPEETKSPPQLPLDLPAPTTSSPVLNLLPLPPLKLEDRSGAQAALIALANIIASVSSQIQDNEKTSINSSDLLNSGENFMRPTFSSLPTSSGNTFSTQCHLDRLNQSRSVSFVIIGSAQICSPFSGNSTEAWNTSSSFEVTVFLQFEFFLSHIFCFCIFSVFNHRSYNLYNGVDNAFYHLRSIFFIILHFLDVRNDYMIPRWLCVCLISYDNRAITFELQCYSKSEYSGSESKRTGNSIDENRARSPKRPHIKRPMNAFMIWARGKRREILKVIYIFQLSYVGKWNK